MSVREEGQADMRVQEEGIKKRLKGGRKAGRKEPGKGGKEGRKGRRRR